jgi:hypothetical protein
MHTAQVGSFFFFFFVSKEEIGTSTLKENTSGSNWNSHG